MPSSQALSFDSSAEKYDRFRPSYPDALFDDLFTHASLSSSSRVLELGSGSGIASLPVAERVSHFLGVEPGTALAAIARRRLADLPHAEIHESTFESFPIAEDQYDLVYSAQAFHWLDPNTRFSRVAETLDKNGSLAIFGNTTLGAAPEYQPELESIYQEVAPDLNRPPPTSWYLPEGPVPELIEASNLFQSTHVSSYPWEKMYSASDYVSLLSTHSDHALLDGTIREDLFSRISNMIDSIGGEVNIRSQASLFVARRITTP